jgi:streptogramin lyase
MDNHGVKVPADQVATITEYLAKNFPEKGKPAGVVIPGPANVSIKAWQVPTPGSRPHDPLATADGALWYTGQMANVLGRLDPNRLASSRSIFPRRLTPDPTAWSKTSPATFGTRAIPGG